MVRRSVLSLVNVAVASAALIVWFRYPQYAMYAIYALLGWFFVSFSLVWVLGTNPGGAPAGPLPSGAPGTGGRGTGSRPFRAGFCIYCAADLPPEATRCPACGHPVALFG